MLWPRLSPERSCVCCRSRRRLGRLRARPASHCNLDRVVFRYQNERRSRLLAASSYCATGIDLFGNPASPVFSPALGPIRTARNGLSAVGRYGHGRTWRLPLGPLPRPIGRPRPPSAMSGLRRHRPVAWDQASGRYRCREGRLEVRPHKKVGPGQLCERSGPNFQRVIAAAFLPEAFGRGPL
jgi:hypothetical protein